MILEVRKYKDQVLKKRAAEVKEIDGRIDKLIKDMLETMYAHQGVGLAAPQVGVSERIAVVDVGDGHHVFINPIILKKIGKIVSEEGCLSVPGTFLKIKRAEKIIIEALNEKGEKFKLEANGLLARCLQQEIDHLDGILILDRLGFWAKLKRKLFK